MRLSLFLPLLSLGLPSPAFSADNASAPWLDPQVEAVLQKKWPNSSDLAKKKLQSLVEAPTEPLPEGQEARLKQGVLGILNGGAKFLEIENKEDKKAVDELKGKIDSYEALLGNQELAFLGKDGGLSEILGAIKGEVQLSEEILNRNPNDPAALTYAGEQYAKNGEPGKARGYFDRALKTDPDNQRALSARARAHYDLGDATAAANDAAAALRLDPQDAGAYAVFKLSTGRKPTQVDLTSPFASSGTGDSSNLTTGAGGDQRTDSKHPYVLQQKFGKVTEPPLGKAGSPSDSGPSGWPLLPTAGLLVGGGLVAYGISRSNGTKESETGLDPGMTSAKEDAAGNPAPVAAFVGIPVAPAVKGAADSAATTGAKAVGRLAARSAASMLAVPIITLTLLFQATPTAEDNPEWLARNSGSAGAADGKTGASGQRETSNEQKPQGGLAPGIGTDESQKEPVWVVRAGIANPKQLQHGTQPHRLVPGLSGFSVQSAPAKSIEELAAGGLFPHGQISVTTVDELRSVGVSVVPSPGKGRYHCTASAPFPLTDEQAIRISAVFRPAIPNPARVRE
jgi:tetratricopeptide (TPR) repeat protein